MTGDQGPAPESGPAPAGDARLLDVADGLMSVAEYAAHAGVSDQTVRNWISKGTITPEASGPWRIDAKKADAQRAHRAKGDGHGGVRAGSGRPGEATKRRSDGATKGKRRAGSPSHPEITPLEARAAIAERAGAGLVPADGVEAESLLNVTRPELVAIVALSDEIGLSQAKLDRLKTIEDLRRRRRENETAEGTLVRAAEVESAWTDAMQRIKGRLAGLPAAAAKAIAAAAWVPPETIDEIRDLLRASGCDPDAAAAAERLLARPGDLEDAVRMALDAEVEGVCRAIAGDG